jgi:hypothetical protein
MISSDLSRFTIYAVRVAASKKPRWGGKRDGAGRPSEVEDPVRFTFDVERAEMDELKTIAELRGESVAKLVRAAVRAYVRRQGKR